MDILQKHKEGRSKALISFCRSHIFITALVCQSSVAFGYNALTHEQITYSAFNYLESNNHFFQETQYWLSGLGNQKDFMKEILVRAAVDADYKLDLWLDGWFHPPSAGGKMNGGSTFFTSMFHHVNVTIPGVFWEHDGYAYRHSSKRGFDSYLATPSAYVRGDLSSGLGGHHHAHPPHGIPLGAYKDGFKGTEKQWKKLFFGDNEATDAVFPPAHVPADIAFQKMLFSPRAKEDRSESWNARIPLVTGFFSDTTLTRHYWRGEVEQLPVGFDLLGLTMHMMQDVTMPHHTFGVADYCHVELENLTDKLSCNNQNLNMKSYSDGSFGSNVGSCQSLYDPQMVKELVYQWEALNPGKQYSISQRILSIAHISSRWKWGEPNNAMWFLGTELPDGRVLMADRCKDLMKKKPVHEQLKYQYNLAVAATVVLFELAAHEYETLHSARSISSFLLGVALPHSF